MFFDTKKYYGVVDEGVFEGRLYICDKKASVQQRTKFINRDLKGAGICYYSWLVGLILSCSCFQLATPLKLIGKEYYVNNHSFVGYIFRKSRESDADQMHSQYLECKNNSYIYDSSIEDRVHACFLKCVESSSTADLWEIIECCLNYIEGEDLEFSNSPPLQIQHTQSQAESSPLLAHNSDILPIISFNDEITGKLMKMLKNANKAFDDHHAVFKRTRGGAIQPLLYSTANKLKSIDHICEHAFSQIKPIALMPVAEAAQGKRPKMEDAYFFVEIEQGFLTGVLDGHGGSEVAKYASKRLQKLFSKVLRRANGDVYKAFRWLIDGIQKEIFSIEAWSEQGSTAVICFIDKELHLIYTATLGDSEAKVYRIQAEGTMSVIPLSCVRNWSSKTDAKRASLALGQPGIATDWPTIENSKEIYFPLYYANMGLNVSRAFGDKFLSMWKGKPGVIHKPKITVHLIKPGDQLILACDGFWDFVSEYKAANVMAQFFNQPETIANKLVSFALDMGHSTDNVTVLSVSVN